MADFNFKDTLIVSLIFFVVGSDFFDTWLKDLFPGLRTSNPLLVTLIKTLVFAGLYYIYYLIRKRNSQNNNNSSSNQSGSGGK